MNELRISSVPIGPIKRLAIYLSASIVVTAALTGCTSSKLETAGSLSTYGNMTTANSLLTKSQYRVDKTQILAARTVSIRPTTFSATTARAKLNDQQRRLISNAIDRSMCAGLSRRFQIVGSGQRADLTVHATITQVTVTDAAIASASQILAAVQPVVLRIPVGMGSLSIEAEATNISGDQNAAMLWARGADVVTSTARPSAAGDAYDLASAFGKDFSKLLVTGENPVNDRLSLPSRRRTPESAACAAFGEVKILGQVLGALGATPGLIDKGAVDHGAASEPISSPGRNPR